MSADIIPRHPPGQRPASRLKAAAALVRIEASVSVAKLLRGLASEGLTLQHDTCTRDFVIRPSQESLP